MRLIDADALVFSRVRIAHEDGTIGGYNAVVMSSVINNSPTIDAVPVIRCKDCKYWLPHAQFGFDEDNNEYHNYCERLVPDDDFYAFTREADEFCSRAERKEE